MTLHSSKCREHTGQMLKEVGPNCPTPKAAGPTPALWSKQSGGHGGMGVVWVEPRSKAIGMASMLSL